MLLLLTGPIAAFSKSERERSFMFSGKLKNSGFALINAVSLTLQQGWKGDLLEGGKIK